MNGIYASSGRIKRFAAMLVYQSKVAGFFADQFSAVIRATIR